MKTYKCDACDYEAPMENSFYSSLYLVNGAFLKVRFCHACVRGALDEAHGDKIASILDINDDALQEKSNK